MALPYGAAVRVRNALYDRRLLPVKQLPLPTVAVGNLTAGGTGKTPAVIWVARLCLRRGLRPAILRRGYGRGRNAFRSDETLLIEETLPEVPVLENPDRAAAAAQAAAAGAQGLILDDGFQHRRVARDRDVVLVDATDPFGGGRLLPRGLLREPLAALARAHWIVVTRSDQVPPAELAALLAQLERLAPQARCAQAVHAPRRLRVYPEGRPARLVELAGAPVRVVCGLGRPQAFLRTLEDLGAEVVEVRLFPDHHPYGADEVAAFLGRPGPPWVTTEKDWVKLRTVLPPQAPFPVWVLGVELEVVAGGEALSRDLLQVFAGR